MKPSRPIKSFGGFIGPLMSRIRQQQRVFEVVNQQLQAEELD